MQRKAFTHRFELIVRETIPEIAWRAVIGQIDSRVWWGLQQACQSWSAGWYGMLRDRMGTSLPRLRRRSYYTGRRQRVAAPLVKQPPRRVLTTIVQIVRRWW